MTENTSPQPGVPHLNSGEVVAAALRDSAEDVATLGWHHRLFSHLPPGQVLRYLCVGGFNTVFGYCTFAAINYLLHRRAVPVSYLFAAAISNFINITVAYLGYKIFVFRTKGDFFREWLKAMAVYWSGFLPGLLLLPVLVRLLNVILPLNISAFHHTSSRKDLAPYIANACLIAIGVVYSFIGHKNVTFRKRPA